MHHYNTRKREQLYPVRVSHEFAKKSILYSIPAVINSCSTNIKDKFYTHSFDGFVFYVKKVTIDNYNLYCCVDNCYVCSN